MRFEKRDAATLDGSEQFDFVTTFDAVHDQARPDLVLRGISSRCARTASIFASASPPSGTLADNLAHPLAPAAMDRPEAGCPQQMGVRVVTSSWCATTDHHRD